VELVEGLFDKKYNDLRYIWVGWPIRYS